MSGEVSFIEFGAADAMTARTFYGKLFGWTFESGPGGDGYAVTGVGVPAGVHGGDPGAAPYVFFRVEDLDAAVAAVERLGGTVESLPGADDEETMATFGEFRLCRDDQGSPFGLHRPPRA
ncbi:putative enzyme related to lactoylglutathione lyase [Agromyces cerinus]|uniref:VOC family protein n=1 Tax=Agromyces cerinus TaxID=33878 RepID=UPI00195D5545|nr:VOC family protein [Agromyces cerinus]MBM7830372.1 putative enzyme related to lactoylglutathione lyase [Agromyces cerinus]